MIDITEVRVCIVWCGQRKPNLQEERKKESEHLLTESGKDMPLFYKELSKLQHQEPNRVFSLRTDMIITVF